MARATPTNQESLFEIHELFFSKTDLKGVILSGNDVFSRVAKFSKEQLVGSPHNIIRHPDMPRIVFKVLWDTIQAGKPISAFVKNLARDGSFYWVVATVFPIDGAYVSVRFKPSGSFFGLIGDIYKQVLAKEKAEGMEASGKFLGEILKGAGFNSYSEFMTEMLVSEMKSRAQLMEGRKLTDSARFDLIGTPENDAQKVWNAFVQIHRNCESVDPKFNRIFARLANFSVLNKVFKERTELILNSINDLKFQSVNMSIASDRVGEMGRTMAVVAHSFQEMAQGIQSQISDFSAAIVNLSEAITVSQFNLAASRLQTEMIGFFVKKYLNLHAENTEVNASEVTETRANSRDLLKLASHFSLDVTGKMASLATMLKQFLMNLEELNSLIVGLDVVRLSGSIESSRNEVLIKAFDTYVNQMQKFLDGLRKPLGEVKDSIQALLKDIEEISFLVAGIGDSYRSLGTNLG